jgi:hypothetical protein
VRAVANRALGSRDNGRYLLVCLEAARLVVGCKAVAEGRREVLVDGIFLVPNDPLHATTKEDASALRSLGSTKVLSSTSHGGVNESHLDEPWFRIDGADPRVVRNNISVSPVCRLPIQYLSEGLWRKHQFLVFWLPLNISKKVNPEGIPGQHLCFGAQQSAHSHPPVHFCSAQQGRKMQ